MVNGLYKGTLPTLPIIRRVPTRYQRILPLALMKRLQCTVVGGAPGVLTVAISDSQQIANIASLEKLTRRRIFVVLVDSSSMRLLISRLERFERQKGKEALGRPYYLHWLQLHAFLHFFNEHSKGSCNNQGAGNFRLLHALKPSPE